MALRHWGGVLLDAETSIAPKHPGPRPYRTYAIEGEAKGLKDWVKDPRNTLGLSESGLKARITRAEKEGREFTIADMQSLQQRYAHRQSSKHAWKRSMGGNRG